MALLFGGVKLTGNKTVIILGRGCGFLNSFSLLCLSTELSSTLWFGVGRKITQADGRYGSELFSLLVGEYSWVTRASAVFVLGSLRPALVLPEAQNSSQ